MKRKQGKLMSFMLSDEVIKYLEKESKQSRLTKTAIVEMAIEEKIKKERRFINEK